ncbi:hypothetical protein DFH09DRAFT_1361096 [Mycena vulgaris]|nr:hypothetical protein DFH09DRAFT_1361096 [Mycena vulgaris]
MTTKNVVPLNSSLFPRGQWNAETPYPPANPSDASLEDIEAGRIGGPAYEEFQVDNSSLAPPAAHVPGTTLPLPALANGHANGSAVPQLNGDANGAPPSAPRRKSSTRSGRPDAPVPRGRFPPTTAPLLPPHRWCARCAIVKPNGRTIVAFVGRASSNSTTTVLVSYLRSIPSLPSLLLFPPSFRALSLPFQSSTILVLLLALPSSTSPPSSLLPPSPALPCSDAACPFFSRRLFAHSLARPHPPMSSSSTFGVRPADAVTVITRGGALAASSTEVYRARSEGVNESAWESESFADADAGSDPAPVRRSQRARDQAGACGGE